MDPRFPVNALDLLTDRGKSLGNTGKDDTSPTFGETPALLSSFKVVVLVDSLCCTDGIRRDSTDEAVARLASEYYFARVGTDFRLVTTDTEPCGVLLDRMLQIHREECSTYGWLDVRPLVVIVVTNRPSSIDVATLIPGVRQGAGVPGHHVTVRIALTGGVATSAEKGVETKKLTPDTVFDDDVVQVWDLSGDGLARLILQTVREAADRQGAAPQ